MSKVYICNSLYKDKIERYCPFLFACINNIQRNYFDTIIKKRTVNYRINTIKVFSPDLRSRHFFSKRIIFSFIGCDTHLVGNTYSETLRSMKGFERIMKTFCFAKTLRFFQLFPNKTRYQMPFLYFDNLILLSRLFASSIEKETFSIASAIEQDFVQYYEIARGYCDNSQYMCLTPVNQCFTFYCFFEKVF